MMEAWVGFIYDLSWEKSYVIILTVISIVCLKAVYKFFINKRPNPFENDSTRPAEPYVSNLRQREKRLKKGFSEDKIPENLDVIVIGSGVGSLATANILSRSGMKVLVLERHDQAGGCLHIFHSRGTQLERIRHIGEMRGNTMLRHLMDQMTDGQLVWSDLDREQDVVAIEEKHELKKYPIVAGYEEWTNVLITSFPEEQAAITSFIRMIKEVRATVYGLAALKIIPRWFAKLLVKLGLIKYITSFFGYSNKTVTQVLDEITDNQELKAVLAYNFGDHGCLPKDASFAMHALQMDHYISGSSFPRGGFSELAFHLIPPIEKAGGRVLVRAKIKHILTDNQGAAVGVRMTGSRNEIDIFAKYIISGAGVINTFRQLLPKQIATKSPLYHTIDKQLHSGIGTKIMFAILNGTKEELGIKAQNHWLFTGSDLDKITSEYLSKSLEDAISSDIPLLFITFHTAKDPTYNDRYPGKSVCAAITLSRYDWFDKWEDTTIMTRGPDYEQVKDMFLNQMWKQCLTVYPHLKDKMEFLVGGSPLSNRDYNAGYRGTIYGLDHTPDRLGSPELAIELRPETDIPGLYLTAQDIFVGNIAGAIVGGLLTASVILSRNVYKDITNLQYRLGNKWKT